MPPVHLGLALASLLFLPLARCLESHVGERHERRAGVTQQHDPRPWERWIDDRWRELTQEANGKLQTEFRETLNLAILASRKALPTEAPPPLSDDTEETGGRGHYGQLPIVRVDQGHGAIFPAEPKKPLRLSWLQALQQADLLRDELRTLHPALNATLLLPAREQPAQVASLLNALLSLRDRLRRHAQLIRYLETWNQPLRDQVAKDHASGRLTTGTLLTQALQFQQRNDATPQLREAMRPRRVLHREFLPKKLPGDRPLHLPLPIATDIQDRRFRTELETALEIHWNQSSWAKEHQVRFTIKWSTGPAWPRATPFNLEQHLQRFPKERLIVTTGAPSTHVQGRALVLGTGSIDGRTLAHELGHLIGFSDCYFRTLSGQGLGGLAIFEWENPFFPDELMCDNQHGTVNRAAW